MGTFRSYIRKVLNPINRHVFSTNEAYDIPSEYYNIDRFHISSRSNSAGFYVRSLTIWNACYLIQK